MSICLGKFAQVKAPFCRDYLDPRYYYFSGVTGGDGPYDLSSCMKPFLVEEIGKNVNSNNYSIVYPAQTNTAKPILISLVIAGYAQYSARNITLKSAVLPSFFAMNCTGRFNTQSNCNVDGVHLNLSSALNSTKLNSILSRAISFSALNKTLNGYNYTNPDEIFTSPNNSVLSFVNKTLLNDELFNQALDDASISTIGDITEVPVFAFSLKNDSIVPPNNTIIFSQHNKTKLAYSFFLDNKNYDVCVSDALQDVFLSDHLNGMFISSIVSINYIETFMRRPK